MSMDKINVQIEGKHFSVIGDEFSEMLAKVKAIPGRSYAQKAWSLPISLEEARSRLAPLQVVDEDGLLEAEVEDIRRVQVRILELKPAIEQKISSLDQEAARYSYGSKSRIKYGLAHDSSLLNYALQYATMPVEKLTEPQIKTLYAALREMEE